MVTSTKPPKAKTDPIMAINDGWAPVMSVYEKGMIDDKVATNGATTVEEDLLTPP